jgi:UDP-N-acetylmuramate dehydrogenase
MKKERDQELKRALEFKRKLKEAAQKADKNELKNQYIITSVCFKLTKKKHKVSTTYGAIETELQHQNIQNPTLKDVSNAVIAIRQSKLPDPKELGNSGSFFKNPIIAKEAYEKAKALHPEIPHYVVSETEVKVPAGWLIEQAGFKGNVLAMREFIKIKPWF